MDREWHEVQSLDGVADRRALPGDEGEGTGRGTFGTAKENDGLDDRTRDTGVLSRYGVT